MLEKIEKFQILCVGVIVSLALIVAVMIVSSSISKNSIMVTGSSYEIVQSDSGVLEVGLNISKANKASAHAESNKQLPKVVEYLKTKGFTDGDIDIKAPSGYYSYKYTQGGNTTNEIDHYNFTQAIKIKSNDVNKIKDTSVDISNLVSKGIDIQVFQSEYYYSKLPELKVKLLQSATTDAKQRAGAMLKATHNRVGKIRSVQMGVFQITPVDSTNVSDMGINDTSTIEKKITSVANVVFQIR